MKPTPNTHDSREGAAYLADLVVCRLMELQGKIEVVQDLRTCLDLRLPDGLLLPLVVEKLRGTPDWIIDP